MSTIPVNKEPNYNCYEFFSNSDTFGYVLSFLQPREHAPLERTCKTWKLFIDSLWKKQCQIQFSTQMGLSYDMDPKEYLPCPTYKENFVSIPSSLLAEDVYRHYIGKVDPAPRIPEAISLKRWNEKDPCDETTTIGKEYVWMYCPSYIEIDQEGFSLDKLDDPKDPEAPKLIPADQSERKTLKVPVTINNIIELFKHPKAGNPSLCQRVLNTITIQHGNKRLASGWVAMRKEVVRRDCTFDYQKKFAKEHNVTITELGHRILFNFLWHTRYSVYPDGVNPLRHAKTLTFTQGAQINWSSGCGAGDHFGLWVATEFEIPLWQQDCVGVSVALPAEVQAIGP